MSEEIRKPTTLLEKEYMEEVKEVNKRFEKGCRSGCLKSICSIITILIVCCFLTQKCTSSNSKTEKNINKPKIGIKYQRIVPNITNYKRINFNQKQR